MYVHPIRPEREVRLVPVAPTAPEPRVAVLLNSGARKFSDQVLRILSHVVQEGDLYVSHSFEEARAIAEAVVAARYTTVFTGGGDGTFVGFFNEIQNAMERKAAASPFAAVRAPRFGILKLGTGNALANLVGASPLRGEGIVDDVLRARANEVPGVLKLSLMIAEGKRAPFAGLGLDAGILNHYVETRRAFAKGPLERLMSGEVGYFAAITGKSVPSYFMRRRPEIEVRTRGFAYRLDATGSPIGAPIEPGALLYHGPAVMAAAATVPCLGYHFRLFPFAQKRRGFMHLRIANVSVPSILANLPLLWKGQWFDPGLHDFLVEDVDVKMDQKVPFEIGGDAEGYRDRVRFHMWGGATELLDFRSTRS
jgi:diacylglycerol kinase family enzyme